MQFDLEKWLQKQENNAFYFTAFILLTGMAINTIPNHIFSLIAFACIFIAFVSTIYMMSRRNIPGAFNILRYFHNLSGNKGINLLSRSYNKQLNKITSHLSEEEKQHMIRIYQVWMNCIFNTKNNFLDDDAAEEELRFWFQPEKIELTRKVFAYMPYTSFIGVFIYSQQSKIGDINQIIKTVFNADDFNKIANYKTEKNLRYYLNLELAENTTRSTPDVNIYKDVFSFIQSNPVISSYPNGVNGLLIYLYSYYTLKINGPKDMPRNQAIIQLNELLSKISLQSNIHQIFSEMPIIEEEAFMEDSSHKL